MSTSARPAATAAPRLIRVWASIRPLGAVLLLHGGWSRGERVPVRRTQPSVLRMLPLADRLALAGRGRLAIYRLLNSYRGWRGQPTPLDDLRWALQQLPAGLPVCLIGHSLGGRAALLGAGDPGVRGAVLLAPWVYPDDDPDLPAGRRLLFVHGDADRIATPDSSRVVADSVRRHATASYVTVPGGNHALMRQERGVDRLAADFAVSLVRPTAPRGGQRVRRLLSGSVDESL